MLGKSGAHGGLAELLNDYGPLVDQLLGDDDDSSGWIGTEEDVLLMMMQRDSRLFAPVRSGDWRCLIICNSLANNSHNNGDRRRSHFQQLPYAAGEFARQYRSVFILSVS
jgi:hypothetical protein